MKIDFKYKTSIMLEELYFESKTKNNPNLRELVDFLLCIRGKSF